MLITIKMMPSRISSGEIAAGIGQLGIHVIRDLSGKQAVAAVGQGVLIERYNRNLERKGIVRAQIFIPSSKAVVKDGNPDYFQDLAVVGKIKS